MRIHVAAALALLGLLGCDDDPVVCGEDTCTDQQVCDPGHQLCVYPDQQEVCRFLVEGEPCEYVRMYYGYCHEGVCLPSLCGDGYILGSEDCEGEDLGGVSCLDLGFQEEAGLACNDHCRFDTRECVGFCGDSLISGTEECDNDDLDGKTCLDFGGPDIAGLQCTFECTFDTSNCF